MKAYVPKTMEQNYQRGDQVLHKALPGSPAVILSAKVNGDTYIYQIRRYNSVTGLLEVCKCFEFELELYKVDREM